MRSTGILNALYIFKRPHKVGTKNQSNPVLHRRKLRYIEVKVAQVHTSRK